MSSFIETHTSVIASSNSPNDTRRIWYGMTNVGW
jgi:hypothetical protein